MVNNTLMITYVLVALCTILILYISIYNNSKDNNKYFTYFIIHLFVYNIGTIMEITAKDFNQLRISIIIRYFGLLFSVNFLLLFVRKYTGKPIKTAIAKVSLFIIPIIVFLKIYIEQISKLYYKENMIPIDIIKNTINTEKGIFYSLIIVYIFIIYIYSFSFAIKSYKEGTLATRDKLKFLIISILTFMIASFAHLLEIKPFGLDIEPIVDIIAIIYMSYCIYIKNIGFSISHTRSDALEKMLDGYILIDERNNFLDANETAIKIFPKLKKAKKTKKAISIFHYVENEAFEVLNDKTVESIEIEMLDEDSKLKNYKIVISSLERKSGTKIRCLVIHDITETKALMTDLQYITKFDALTGVYNRKTFFELANEMFKNNIANEKSFAILMVDIDFFKTINDSYGHIFGDKVLSEVANRLSKVLRKSDIIARYGGEEFVIYIENIDQENALIIAEKLRTSISDEKFFVDNIAVDISLSIGVTLFRKGVHKDIEELLILADSCLYEAKNKGRNKVVIS